MDSMKKVIKIIARDLRTNRSNDSPKEYSFNITDVKLVNDIKKAVALKVGNNNFILCMPNRTLITDSNLKEIRSGDSVLILESLDQPFREEVKFTVNIAPHPDTITKSGMYEYYSSRGIDSIVISIAELIDNSLAATKHNLDLRLIEIRFYEINNDSMMCIIDNGCGMNNYELRNWAKFKYSKFVRDNRFNDNHTPSVSQSFTQSDSGFFGSFSSSDLPLRPNRCSTPVPNSSNDDYKPRYLDSEINYFGAGGKQAIFNIGEKTTMTSKKSVNNDIHVLTLSKSEFDEKSKSNPDDVYKVELISRTKGVERQLPNDMTTSAYIEGEIIKEMEDKYESFTVCCIKNVITKHLDHLRKGPDSSSNWIKSLARIYHYYLHGPQGNTLTINKLPPELQNLRIKINIFSVSKVGGIITPHLRHDTNLRDIDDDFETQLVRTAADTFEFDVVYEGKANIEGVIRYHPYLHDKETLPKLDANDELGETGSLFSHRTDVSEFNVEDNEDFRRSESMKHKEREVFECFWHGRLIPQDVIDFDWNKYNTKSNKKNIEECFNRLSGALFTNYTYEVSQNKQSFIDLSKTMAQKHLTSFFKVTIANGERRLIRGNFEIEFVKWIETCHTKYDKQVKYSNFQGYVSRTDQTLPSGLKRFTRTDTFTVFNEIRWRNKKWKKGDKIKTTGTKPSNLLGAIERFFVPIKLDEGIANYEGSPGFLEISQLPAEIFGNDSDAQKIILFTQINFQASKQEIENELLKSLEKFPDKIVITFPRRYPINEGDKIVAGRPIGDIKAFIQNRVGTVLKDRIPYKALAGFRILTLQLEILEIFPGGQTSTAVEYDLCKWSRQWEGYWFTEKEEGIKKVGNYSLQAVALITSDGKKEAVVELPNKKPLPSAKPINFEIIAGPAKRFMICGDKIPILIGEPFCLKIKFYDEFDNESKPILLTNKSLILTISGYIVNYASAEAVANDCIIKNICVLGKIDFVGKEVIMEVEVPALPKKQEVRLVLAYGHPNNIKVDPEEQLEFVNGTVPEFRALVYDRGGNDLTFLSRLQVFCKFQEINANGHKSIVSQSSEYPMIEGLRNEQRCLVLRKEVIIKVSGERSLDSRNIIARFYLRSDPRVSLERQIIVKRSCKPTAIKLFFTNNANVEPEYIEIPNEKTLEFPAGSALSGVFFKAYDCDGSEITLPEFDVSTLAFSWATNTSQTITNGELPNLVMPTSTQELRAHFIEWKQIDKNINLRHSFLLQSYSDSPERISVECAETPLVFPLGVVVGHNIYVKVVDIYNNLNRSNDILSRLVIRPVSQFLRIDETSLKKVISRKPDEGSFIISGIKLLPTEDINTDCRVLGKTELSFKINGSERLINYLNISVVNGIPNSLIWYHMKYNGVILITNNQRLQLQTRLLDEFKNGIIDSQLSAKLILGEDFLTPELTANLDSEGVAVFSEMIRIKSKGKLPAKCTIPKEIQLDLHSCQRPCYGWTKILAEVRYYKKIIQTSPYWLHVLCDSKTPAKFEIEHIGSLNVITNTSTMPTIMVKVMAEDNTVIRDVDEKKLQMHLIDIEENCCEFSPKKVTNGIFNFKPDLSPTPNKYKVKIVYNGLQTFEKFYKEVINVIPGSPFKMRLKSQPLNDPIIVSNTENNRTIITRSSPLQLELVDSSDVPIYQNICDQELKTNPIYFGILRARIFHSNGNEDEVPELEGCDSDKFLNFQIKGGETVVQELKLKTNTRGIDSEHYLIQLDAKLSKSSIKLEPFVMRILFCDDSNKQTQLEEIQMCINNDSQRKKKISKELSDIEKDEEIQNNNYNACLRKERQLRAQLEEVLEEDGLRTEQSIKSKIEEYMNLKAKLEVKECNRTSRGLNLSIAPQKDAIIGRIAHLAFIEDNETALIISWFLRNYMKCIVTKTSEEAEKIMEENTEDIDQTFPLDQIHDKDVPKEWNDRLPHDNKFDVSYNVGYARNTLEFNDYLLESSKVFGALLNNTLIMDTIRDAKAYRKKFKKYEKLGKCPTILTRKGFILHENGIIDKSAPLENFTSAAFQTPPNKELKKVIKIIDLLQHLSEAVKHTSEELKSFNSVNKSYENLKKRKREDLQKVEQSLDSSQTEFNRLSLSGLSDKRKTSHNNMRSREDSRSSVDSEPFSKRSRITH